MVGFAVTPVPHYDIPIIWKLISNWIGIALDAEKVKLYSVPDIYKALMNRDMQLWIHEDACLVTQIVKYPQASICTLLLLGGSRMENWIDYVHQIESWAKENGCSETRIYGRKGWERVLKNHGYEHESSVLVKELT